MLGKDKASCCFSEPVGRAFLLSIVFILFHSVFQLLSAKFRLLTPWSGVGNRYVNLTKIHNIILNLNGNISEIF